MKTIKIFIASSAELRQDRDDFRSFIGEENKRLVQKGIFLETVDWEHFLDAISDTRLQDEYNQAITACDIVLCLFFTKVGKYTAEEFDTAYEVFKDKGKPKIWTYFKNAPLNTGSITNEINTLLEFKKKIGALGHFYTEYTNIDNLLNKYRSQLDKFLTQYESGSYSIADKTDDANDGRQPESAIANTFNELLTKRLIISIKPYSKNASDFLNTNPDWETNPDLVSTAKKIIFLGFVGVIGIQLRKLMSIGEEDFSAGKMKRYLENCNLTIKRALQLISYVLISKLWDYRSNTNVNFSETQSNGLIKFFKNAAEENIRGYTELLKILIEVFNQNKLELPIGQLKELYIHLQAGSLVMEACTKLQAVNELLKSSAYTISDCFEAENNMAVIMEQLSFLAEYKMISIKDIDYDQQRNDKAGIYLHHYSLLEGDSQFNTNDQGKVKKEYSPVISYAVLLFKDDYRKNINLVPFIIDYNALANNGGSKICFYSYCNTYDDHDLNYSFIEDNTKVSIKKSRNTRPSDDIAFNKWLANPGNRKDMNLDNVYTLFSEAKKILAGLEEESTDSAL